MAVRSITREPPKDASMPAHLTVMPSHLISTYCVGLGTVYTSTCMWAAATGIGQVMKIAICANALQTNNDLLTIESLARTSSVRVVGALPVPSQEVRVLNGRNAN